MKKILLVLFVVFSFTGCDLITNATFENSFSGQSIYYGDFPEMYTYTEIATYVCTLLEYKPDPEGTQIIDGPEKAIKQGYGDCEEFALAFMNIVYVVLGEKINLAVVDIYDGYTGNRTIGTGGDFNHALVRINGIIYSAYNGLPCPELQAAYYLTFDKVFDV